MATDKIDFYFDFSSPYGYLASTRIEKIAADNSHEVAWNPILLGAIFKTTGQQPLTDIPLKGDYGRHDFARSAREQDIAFSLPTRFPIGTVAACRAVYWLSDRNTMAGNDGSDGSSVAGLVHALFRALYIDDRPIDGTDTVLAVADECGLDAKALGQALSSTELKARLKRAVDAAVVRGVFGSPMMFVGKEPFWGNDRLEQLHRWLSRGGW